jgi:AraC-like DNA-binding protein
MRPLFEKVPVQTGESLACREFRLQRFPSPRHHHPELELTLIVAGNGVRLVGDAMAYYGPGDLVLLGPNLPHVWHSAEPREPRGSHSVVLQFPASLFEGALFDTPELGPVRRMLHAAAFGLSFGPRASSTIAPELRRVVDLAPARRLLQLLHILESLATTEDQHTIASPGYRPNDSELALPTRIDRVCRYVLERYASEEIRLADVAAIAHMSPEAFCRTFKRSTGRSLIEFVNELRVGRARRLLLEGELSISEVCYESGYANLSHFNRQFLRRTGMTPRVLRERSRAAAAGPGGALARAGAQAAFFPRNR